MNKHIEFFGDFISSCFRIFDVDIFDWGFSFADLFITGILIFAVLFFVKSMIGMPGRISWHRPIVDKNKSDKGGNKNA